MEPNNPPAPPQRFITSAAQFHQLQEEARAAALQGANAAKCADFPKTDDEKLVLIDQLLAAMTNTAGLVDNVGENPDENGDVKAIRNMPRERQEEMAWIWLYKMRDIQLGIRNPDVYTPEFPNFMSRFRAFVSFVRSTKAGVTDLFAASYADRYIGNPVAELDTKVSNNHTNKLRIYNNDLKGARDNGRTIIENDNIAEIRDAAGTLIKTLIKPRKRPLDDFLDGALPPAVKKPKRAPRSRTATGSSAASVATATTTGVGAQPVPAQGAASSALPLPAIQEEEEPSEAPQATMPNSQVDAGQSSVDQSNIGQHNIDQQDMEQSNIEQPNIGQQDMEQPIVYQPFIYQQNMEQSNMEQSNIEQFNNGQQDIEQFNNGQQDIEQFNIEQFNIEQSNIGQQDIGQQDIGQQDIEKPNIDKHNAEHAHPGQYPAGQYHGANPYNQPYNAPSQYPVPDQYGAQANWAGLEQAPAVPARFSLDAVDPALGDHSNQNGGSQGGSERAEVNQPGLLVQNKAGANWWVPDDSSDDVE